VERLHRSCIQAGKIRLRAAATARSVRHAEESETQESLKLNAMHETKIDHANTWRECAPR